jgi:hypothetical protein
LKRSKRDGDRFSPQPFTHVAHVYARSGRREDARRILLAQHDLRTLQASAGPFTWALSSLFGVIAGYGSRRFASCARAVLFLALGVVGVLAMNAQGALVTPQGRACNGVIEPTLYAIDVALPVIDLGQEGRCGPGARARRIAARHGARRKRLALVRGCRTLALGACALRHAGCDPDRTGGVTFSGIMKPKDD